MDNKNVGYLRNRKKWANDRNSPYFLFFFFFFQFIILRKKVEKKETINYDDVQKPRNNNYSAYGFHDAE